MKLRTYHFLLPAVVLGLLDIAGINFLYSHFPQYVYESVLLDEEALGLMMRFWGLVFLSYTVLVGFCWILDRTLKPSRPLFLWIGVVVIVVGTVVFQNPQILQDNPFIAWIAFSYLPDPPTWGPLFVISLFCVFVAVSVNGRLNLMGVGFAFAISAYSLSIIYDISPSAGLSKLHHQIPDGSVLIISIDSADERLEKALYLYGNESVQEFLKHSKFNPLVVSNQAQTHVSLNSFIYAEDPLESRVRFAFQKLRPTEKKTIFSTNSSEFENYVVLDSGETFSFDQSEVHHVLGPKHGPESIFLNRVMFSKIFHFLWNHEVGRMLSPNLFENHSLPFFYSPSKMTTKSLELIKNRNTQKPQFIFAHFCFPTHSPQQLPFPYAFENPARGWPNSAFGSAPKANLILPNHMNRDQLLYINQRYEQSLRFFVEKMLNPIFESLDVDLKKTKIILMSDHGQDIRKSQSDFSGRARALNGKSLLFWHNSEYVYFRSNIPSLWPNGQVQNLSQASRNLFFQDKPSGFKNSVWSETGFKFYHSFSGGWLWPTPLAFALENKYVGKSRSFELSQHFLSQQHFESQKAVYEGTNRSTLYITNRGYRWAACSPLVEDDCKRNLWDLRPPSAQKNDIRAMSDLIMRDPYAGALRSIRLPDELNSIKHIKKMLASEMMSERWLGLTMSLHRMHTKSFFVSKALHEIELAQKSDLDLIQSQLALLQGSSVYTDLAAAFNSRVQVLYPNENSRRSLPIFPKHTVQYFDRLARESSIPLDLRTKIFKTFSESRSTAMISYEDLKVFASNLPDEDFRTLFSELLDYFSNRNLTATSYDLPYEMRRDSERFISILGGLKKPLFNWAVKRLIENDRLTFASEEYLFRGLLHESLDHQSEGLADLRQLAIKALEKKIREDNP